MTDEKLMSEDLFADDSFTYKKVIRIANRSDPCKVTEYEFELKEMTGSEKDRVGKSSMKINSKTGEFDFNQEEANYEYLKASLVKAPFALNEKSIRDLSTKIRDELLDFAKKINQVDSEIQKK